MDAQALEDFCAGFTGVTRDCPFGPQPVCYRVGGKIFAEVYPLGVEGALRILRNDPAIPRERIVPMAIFKCDPVMGTLLRAQYPGRVMRPYHCPPAQQPYANTVLLDGHVPGAVIRDMASRSYAYVWAKLTRKARAQIVQAAGLADDPTGADAPIPR